jgi:hypothetical protein
MSKFEKDYKNAIQFDLKQPSKSKDPIETKVNQQNEQLNQQKTLSFPKILILNTLHIFSHHLFILESNLIYIIFSHNYFFVVYIFSHLIRIKGILKRMLLASLYNSL